MKFPPFVALSTLSLLAAFPARGAEQIVVDFENAILTLQEEKANRVEKWEEKGVVFTLARAPKASKAKGLLMFFPHLSTGKKGIVCAMATEPIPVRATFPKPASAVTLSMWGSTATPVVVEAFDADGKIVDRAKLESVPDRKAPGDPIPIFEVSVKAPQIAYIEFSGPREGEYLAADELRLTVAEPK